ncbi:MAG: SAM-dependent methyltransferase [Acidimicrobiales bacterium]
MTSAKRIADIKGGHVLERGVPLSRSRLWDFERGYYERQGLRAWGDGEVPSAITSNPVIAWAYAEVIVAFLRDCDDAGLLDRSRRVHVLELGAGSGRLGYSLIRRLQAALAATTMRDQPLTVVLSDFDQAKLEQLAAHPRLQEHLASGWLDFAVVDAAAPGQVRTWRGDLVAGAPLVVVANYVFDSFPADIYAIRQGAAHEVGLTITADAPEVDRHDPKALSRLRFSWDPADTPTAPTGRPEIDGVLADYVATLDSTMVMVPTVALACLEHLAAAAGAPTLALVADKGWAHLRDLQALGPPVFVPDGGSFSMMVNFDAVARVVRAGGGTVLLPPHQPQHLVVGAFVLGQLEASETARRYHDVLGEGGPDDIHAFRASVVPAGGKLTLQRALSMLRTTRWDSRTFLELFPNLYAESGELTPQTKADLALAVARVWDEHFPIGEPANIALYLGLLLSRIGHHREALPYFTASHELMGDNAEAHFGAARAHHALRELDEALKEVREALALKADLDLARALALELEAELGRDDGGAGTRGGPDTGRPPAPPSGSRSGGPGLLA